MFGFIARVIGVAVLILIGFVLYQEYLNPSVTNADLIQGANKVGKKVVDLGKEAADSVLSKKSKPPLDDVTYQEPYVAKGSDATAASPAGPNEIWPDELAFDSAFADEPLQSEGKRGDVNEIIQKYKDLNILLESNE